MAFLVDTNILVYRFDGRNPAKRLIATEALKGGIRDGTARLPHQALIEFVAAVTRPVAGRSALLSEEDARLEAEDLLNQIPILWPTEGLIRTALRGWAVYGLSWYDAHLWAYADHYGLDEILSEDFQHGRFYGSVRAVNPFLRV